MVQKRPNHGSTVARSQPQHAILREGEVGGILRRKRVRYSQLTIELMDNVIIIIMIVEDSLNLETCAFEREEVSFGFRNEVSSLPMRDGRCRFQFSTVLASHQLRIAPSKWKELLDEVKFDTVPASNPTLFPISDIDTYLTVSCWWRREIHCITHSARHWLQNIEVRCTLPTSIHQGM